MTRTVSAHLFSAVNGVVESPEKFQFDSFGPEEGELMGRSLAGVTDVVIGRVLWQEWREYWPPHGDDDPFATFINPVRKHVLTSAGSRDLDWNSTAIEGDPAGYVRSLAGDGTGGIVVCGGIETVSSLFLAGVIDTLTFTMHPATGQGRRLFDETVPVTRLRLVDHTITSAGNAVLTYSLRK